MSSISAWCFIATDCSSFSCLTVVVESSGPKCGCSFSCGTSVNWPGLSIVSFNADPGSIILATSWRLSSCSFLMSSLWSTAGSMSASLGSWTWIFAVSTSTISLCSKCKWSSLSASAWTLAFSTSANLCDVWSIVSWFVSVWISSIGVLNRRGSSSSFSALLATKSSVWIDFLSSFSSVCIVSTDSVENVFLMVSLWTTTASILSWPGTWSSCLVSTSDSIFGTSGCLGPCALWTLGSSWSDSVDVMPWSLSECSSVLEVMLISSVSSLIFSLKSTLGSITTFISLSGLAKGVACSSSCGLSSAPSFSSGASSCANWSAEGKMSTLVISSLSFSSCVPPIFAFSTSDFSIVPCSKIEPDPSLCSFTLSLSWAAFSVSVLASVSPFSEGIVTWNPCSAVSTISDGPDSLIDALAFPISGISFSSKSCCGCASSLWSVSPFVGVLGSKSSDLTHSVSELDNVSIISSDFLFNGSASKSVLGSWSDEVLPSSMLSWISCWILALKSTLGSMSNSSICSSSESFCWSLCCDSLSSFCGSLIWPVWPSTVTPASALSAWHSVSSKTNVLTDASSWSLSNVNSAAVSECFASWMSMFSCCFVLSVWITSCCFFSAFSFSISRTPGKSIFLTASMSASASSSSSSGTTDTSGASFSSTIVPAISAMTPGTNVFWFSVLVDSSKSFVIVTVVCLTLSLITVTELIIFSLESVANNSEVSNSPWWVICCSVKVWGWEASTSIASFSSPWRLISFTDCCSCSSTIPPSACSVSRPMAWATLADCLSSSEASVGKWSGHWSSFWSSWDCTRISSSNAWALVICSALSVTVNSGEVSGLSLGSCKSCSVDVIWAAWRSPSFSFLNFSMTSRKSTLGSTSRSSPSSGCSASTSFITSTWPATLSSWTSSTSFPSGTLDCRSSVISSDVMSSWLIISKLWINSSSLSSDSMHTSFLFWSGFFSMTPILTFSWPLSGCSDSVRSEPSSSCSSGSFSSFSTCSSVGTTSMSSRPRSSAVLVSWLTAQTISDGSFSVIESVEVWMFSCSTNFLISCSFSCRSFLTRSEWSTRGSTSCSGSSLCLLWTTIASDDGPSLSWPSNDWSSCGCVISPVIPTSSGIKTSSLASDLTSVLSWVSTLTLGSFTVTANGPTSASTLTLAGCSALSSSCALVKSSVNTFSSSACSCTGLASMSFGTSISLVTVASLVDSSWLSIANFSIWSLKSIFWSAKSSSLMAGGSMTSSSVVVRSGGLRSLCWCEISMIVCVSVTAWASMSSFVDTVVTSVSFSIFTDESSSVGGCLSFSIFDFSIISLKSALASISLSPSVLTRVLSCLVIALNSSGEVFPVSSVMSPILVLSLRSSFDFEGSSICWHFSCWPCLRLCSSVSFSALTTSLFGSSFSSSCSLLSCSMMWLKSAFGSTSSCWSDSWSSSTSLVRDGECSMSGEALAVTWVSSGSGSAKLSWGNCLDSMLSSSVNDSCSTNSGVVSLVLSSRSSLKSILGSTWAIISSVDVSSWLETEADNTFSGVMVATSASRSRSGWLNSSSWPVVTSGNPSSSWSRSSSISSIVTAASIGL